ncbi:MAG: hypothetical protein MJ150_04415, partial [Clostridia bacterium]|nr:hypothetical protein [Clostridia bacterium]
MTVRPVVLLGIHFIFQIFEYEFSQTAMTIACLLFCLIQTVLYYLTFTGKISTKIPVLLSYLAFILLVALDKTFAYYWGIYVNKALAFLISDATIVLGIVCLILAPKKLPAPKEGDEYRPRYGDRIDGRLVRNLPPMTKAIPYIMVNRNGASNLIRDSIEVSNMEKYIHKMRREGYKHFGITHVFLATYVRLCAEYPGLNRFLSGQKIFHRYTIDVNMVVKKEMTTDAPDTAIKVIF